MSGGATSETIIFIGAIVAASALAGAGIALSHDFANAYSARLDAQAEQLTTDITLINDARNVETSPLELHVMNTGSQYVWSSDLFVMVDGQVATDVAASQEGIGPNQWVTLTVSGLSLQPGDHVASVFAGGKASDELVFRVDSP